MAKQVNGAYKVKHPDMKPLHAEALDALAAFDAWRVRPSRGRRTPPPTRSSTRRWTRA